MAARKGEIKIHYSDRKQTKTGLKFRVTDERGQSLGYFNKRDTMQLEALHN